MERQSQRGNGLGGTAIATLPWSFCNIKAGFVPVPTSREPPQIDLCGPTTDDGPDYAGFFAIGGSMGKKRILAALMASSALGGPALAADLAPILKAPPRPALAPVSGYLELEGGYAWERNRGTEASFSPTFAYVPYSGSDSKWVFNGAGRVNWWITPTVSSQFDVWGGADSFQRQSVPGSTRDFGRGTTASINVGGHVSYRLPDRYLVGLFGSVGNVTSLDFCCSSGQSFGFTHGTIGLEGQAYFGMLTLYGQGGVQANLSDAGNGNNGRGASAGDFTAWFLRGVARYFINDNLRLEASALYAQGHSRDSEDFAPSFLVSRSLSTSFNLEHLMWTAGIEKKLDNLPLSLFARYQGSFTRFKTNFDTGYASPPTATNSVETTEHMVKAGIRIYLNEGTLKYNDRLGTTLDIADPLTSAYRATGRSLNCDNCSTLSVSDIRLKRDIVELTQLPNGVRIYSYRYLWSDQVYVGVMAQQVADIAPEAVRDGGDGFFRVDYRRLGLRLMTWEDWLAGSAQLPIAA